MIGWQLVADQDAHADQVDQDAHADHVDQDAHADHVDQDAHAHGDADQKGVRVLGDSTGEEGDRVAAGG